MSGTKIPTLIFFFSDLGQYVWGFLQLVECSDNVLLFFAAPWKSWDSLTPLSAASLATHSASTTVFALLQSLLSFHWSTRRWRKEWPILRILKNDQESFPTKKERSESAGGSSGNCGFLNPFPLRNWHIGQ